MLSTLLTSCANEVQTSNPLGIRL